MRQVGMYNGLRRYVYLQMSDVWELPVQLSMLVRVGVFFFMQLASSEFVLS